MCGRGACVAGVCAWQWACVAGDMHDGGICGGGGGGHAWQERQPLQQTVHILLECILVLRLLTTTITPDHLAVLPER